MIPRFTVEEGRFGNFHSIVDLKQPTPNGPKIIANCSSKAWADNIVWALETASHDRGENVYDV